jgi:hypothetical protein
MAIEDQLQELVSLLQDIHATLRSALLRLPPQTARPAHALGATTAVEVPKPARGRARKQDLVPADPEPDVPDYDAVRLAVTGYMSRNGYEKTRELLGKFGVTSGHDLTPEQYAAVIEAAR